MKYDEPKPLPFPPQFQVRSLASAMLEWERKHANQEADKKRTDDGADK